MIKFRIQMIKFQIQMIEFPDPDDQIPDPDKQAGIQMIKLRIKISNCGSALEIGESSDSGGPDPTTM